MTRAIIPFCVAFGWCIQVLAQVPVVPQPNILFILVDDLAYNDIGCFAYPGHEAEGVKPPAPFPEKSAVAAPNQAVAEVNGVKLSLTPNLDQLAKDGLKLTNYHAPSSVCSPSRLGLMTGRTPARFRLVGIISQSNHAGLPSREITWPEVLKGRGYVTAAFGKWHLGNGEQHAPTQHGFDHYSPGDGERATELERLTNEVLEFVKTHRDGPFLAYFAPHQPHHRNVPHPNFAGSSSKLLGPRSYLKGDGTSEVRKVRGSDFHDVVHELDYRIGLLLKGLDQLGLRDNTMVIFTSDNGPWTNQPQAASGKEGIIGTGYPYRGGKSEYWEGSTRVPALIRYPKQIPAGRSSSALMSGLDWFQTLGNRAGGVISKDRLLDGYDMWPVLTGNTEQASPRSYLYYERGKKVLAVSDGEFKYSSQGLVDLKTDFTESVDVESSHPAIAARMKAEIARANARLEADMPGLEEFSEQRLVVHAETQPYVPFSKGDSAIIQVSLKMAPHSEVVVNVQQRSSSPDFSVSPVVLTFTAENWKTPQSLTVKGSKAGSYATLELVGPAQVPIREVYVHAQP